MGKTGSGQLLQGTLPLLVLRILYPGPNHGFAIARRIQTISRDVLHAEAGSLYPALHRLERQGLLASEWKISEKNQRAKYYRLTSAGRKYLVQEESKWDLLVKAVSLVRMPT